MKQLDLFSIGLPPMRIGAVRTLAHRLWPSVRIQFRMPTPCQVALLTPLPAFAGRRACFQALGTLHRLTPNDACRTHAGDRQVQVTGLW